MELHKNNFNKYDIERNIGIDILRILAMFMIVLGHLIWHGGIIKNIGLKDSSYYIVYFVDILTSCAVNCYAMTTGYLLCNSKLKPSRIISLWIQVQFYSVGIAIMLYFISNKVGYKDIASAMLPILRNQYWYFTSYCALFCLTPFLNNLISNLDSKKLKNLIIILIILFSVLPTVSTNDIFGINRGYSVAWLAILYIIGAYIRENEHNLKFNSYIYLLAYIGVSIIVLCGEIIGNILLSRFGISGIEIRDILVSYTSIFILITSICLFTAFIRFNPKINSFLLRNLISIISVATFGVYLIHDNILVRNIFIKDKLTYMTHYSQLQFIIKIVTIAFFVFILCTTIEILRIKIFGILKIDKFINKLSLYLFNRKLKVE